MTGRLLLVVLLTVACRRAELKEEIVLPVRPQQQTNTSDPDVIQVRNPISVSQLRVLAGENAIDCGVGRDRATDDVVYRCGEFNIRSGRSFFCRYDSWPESRHANTPLASYQITLPAYAYDGKGTLHQLLGSAVPKVVLRNNEAPTALWPERGMRPPLIGLMTKITGLREITGSAWVFITIREDGTVAAVDHRNRLDPRLKEQIDKFVKSQTFSPAMLFGVPVPVVFSQVLQVRNGVVHLGRAT